MVKKYLAILKKPGAILVLTVTALWLSYSVQSAAAPPQQGEDIGVISSPADNAVVSGVVPIIGSADHPSFQFYIVEFSPEPVSNQWQIIGEIRETPVINGELVTWDTTLVPDGSYTLRLRVVRLDGNYTEAFSRQVVVANTQPTPTNTPAVQFTPTPQTVNPTATPTELPPTPTIVIEQPVVETPTPRPVATTPPLEDPDEETSFIPTVQGFSVIPLRDACLYGGALMLSVFIFFGFLSALRLFIKGFIDARRN